MVLIFKLKQHELTKQYVLKSNGNKFSIVVEKVNRKMNEKIVKTHKQIPTPETV